MITGKAKIGVSTVTPEGRRKARRIGGILLLAMLAASLVAVWMYSRQEPDLLSNATRRVPRGEIRGECLWLSAHELLLIEGSNEHPRALSLDIRTHVKTPLPGLEAALGKFNRDFALASPDGQWLLCAPFDGEDDAHVVSLDGARTLRWKVRGSTRLAWMPDSKRWVRMVVEAGKESAVDGTQTYLSALNIYDVRAPKSVQTLPMVQPFAIEDEPLFLSGGSRLQRVTQVPAPPPTPDGYSNKSEALKVLAWSVTSERVAPTGRHTIRLPEQAKVDGVVVSPQGDRLAWMAGGKRPVSLWRPLLKRWIRGLAVGTEDTLTLYTARTDGSDIRILGMVPSVEEGDYWRSLEWLPDGKSLSFQYRGALYTIPAE